MVYFDNRKLTSLEHIFKVMAKHLEERAIVDKALEPMARDMAKAFERLNATPCENLTDEFLRRIENVSLALCLLLIYHFSAPVCYGKPSESLQREIKAHLEKCQHAVAMYGLHTEGGKAQICTDLAQRFLALSKAAAAGWSFSAKNYNKIMMGIAFDMNFEFPKQFVRCIGRYPFVLQGLRAYVNDDTINALICALEDLRKGAQA